MKTSSNPPSIFQATKALRILRIKPYSVMHLSESVKIKNPGFFHRDILQQAWRDDHGNIEWRDVEIVEVEEEIK